jgi:hypothetical protein
MAINVEWAPLAVISGTPISWHDIGWAAGARNPDGSERSVEMPGLAVVVPGEPGAILESFSLDGDWFGDNWFTSVEEAKEVAAEWWGGDLGEWQTVDASADDDYQSAVLAAARMSSDPG